MPGPGLTDSEKPTRGVHVTLMDYRGKTHSQFIPTTGGEVGNDQDKDLAIAIAQCSNAALYKFGKSDLHTYQLDEMDPYDEAEASVERQIVMVFQHRDYPNLTEEVVIPAFDATMLLPDMVTPDMTNGALQTVRDRALGVLNDNLLNTDYFKFKRAYTTTRKIGRRIKGTFTALPGGITEPGPTAEPGPGPAATPIS